MPDTVHFGPLSQNVHCSCVLPDSEKLGLHSYVATVPSVEMVYLALATAGGAAQAAFCSEDCEMAAFGDRTAPLSGGSAGGLDMVPITTNSTIVVVPKPTISALAADDEMRFPQSVSVNFCSNPANDAASQSSVSVVVDHHEPRAPTDCTNRISQRS